MRESKTKFGLVEKDSKEFRKIRKIQKMNKEEEKRIKDFKFIDKEYLTIDFVQKYGKIKNDNFTFYDIIRFLINCETEKQLFIIIKCLRKVLQAPGCKF